MALTLSRRAAMMSALSAGSLSLLARAAGAQGVAANTGGAAAAIDAFVQQVMAAYPDQPAVGVAVVENGVTTLTRGYGVRKLGEAARVDETTLFGIASNTKAMTAAAIAMLVEAGQVEWDAPVTRYMPGFEMSDPTVTRLMTVRDLLVHRSGLSLGAGDLMIWPSTLHTRAEIVAGLKHLPISGRFRDGYAYDNVLYVAAGMLIEAVSGMSWEAFIQTRIFDPLGMADSTPAPRADRIKDSAWPHVRLGPPVRGLGEMKPIGFDASFQAAAPAGGVNASPRDIAKWMQVQLALGALPDGRRLWSEVQSREMWKPQTITSSGVGPDAEHPARPTLTAYALGWVVSDFRGERVLDHSGGLAGFISRTQLLPGRRSGVMIMTNAEESGVLRSLRYGGMDRLAGRDDFDWIADSRRLDAESEASTLRGLAEATTVAGGGRPASLPRSAYTGVYRDPWYGTVTVSERDGGLHLAFDKSPVLKGALEPFDGDTFRARFPADQEDAFVTFTVENGRVVSATMKAVSPLADFSYDFQDLRLTKV